MVVVAGGDVGGGCDAAAAVMSGRPDLVVIEGDDEGEGTPSTAPAAAAAMVPESSSAAFSGDSVAAWRLYGTSAEAGLAHRVAGTSDVFAHGGVANAQVRDIVIVSGGREASSPAALDSEPVRTAAVAAGTPSAQNSRPRSAGHWPHNRLVRRQTSTLRHRVRSLLEQVEPAPYNTSGDVTTTGTAAGATVGIGIGGGGAGVRSGGYSNGRPAVRRAGTVVYDDGTAPAVDLVPRLQELLPVSLPGSVWTRTLPVYGRTPRCWVVQPLGLPGGHLAPAQCSGRGGVWRHCGFGG